MSITKRRNSGVDFTASRLKVLFSLFHVWSLAKNGVFALVSSSLTKSSKMIVVRGPQIRASNERVKESKIYVSEVHIPGYRKSKLPFILHDYERNYESNLINVGSDGGSSLESPPPVAERIYEDKDSKSMIPYLDGYLLHKTCHPILTPNECQMIIDEAETICKQYGWTTTRHGNFP
jgi:hypothetical protein